MRQYIYSRVIAFPHSTSLGIHLSAVRGACANEYNVFVCVSCVRVRESAYIDVCVREHAHRSVRARMCVRVSLRMSLRMQVCVLRRVYTGV